MSTARFAISHAPRPAGELPAFIYQQKPLCGGTGTAPPTPTPAPSCSTASAGEGQFFIQGQLYPVQPDDLVIVNPQVEHTELSLNAAPLEYVVLGISGHRGAVRQQRRALRHPQLPRAAGAPGRPAAYAAGRGRPQPGRLRDGLPGPAGSAC